MRLMVLVLNKTEKLELVLAELARAGIGGATVFNSTGMVKILSDYEENDIPFIGSIRALLNPERSKNYTVLIVIKDEQLETAVKAIEKIVGDISNQDTGIIFSVPIDFAKGLPHLEL